MRSVCVLLAIVLLGAAPAPEAASAAASADRTARLIGTWSCRDGYGVVSHVAYRSTADGFASTRTMAWPGGKPESRTSVYRRGADGSWSIEIGTSYDRVHATAPAWTGDTWPVTWRYGNEWYAFTDDNTLRRMSGDVPTTVSDLCLRGDAPPEASVCVTPDLPAMVYRVVEPDMPAVAAQRGIEGVVRVLVSIDAESHVVQTKIVSSPSELLNNAAASAARRSKYFTAHHECKAVPSEYTFNVSFQRG